MYNLNVNKRSFRKQIQPRFLGSHHFAKESLLHCIWLLHKFSRITNMMQSNNVKMTPLSNLMSLSNSRNNSCIICSNPKSGKSELQYLFVYQILSIWYVLSVASILPFIWIVRLLLGFSLCYLCFVLWHIHLLTSHLVCHLYSIRMERDDRLIAVKQYMKVLVLW